MADEVEHKEEDTADRGGHVKTGTHAGSGRGKHGEEQLHRSHNEHTEDHKGERRQSDSRR